MLTLLCRAQVFEVNTTAVYVDTGMEVRTNMNLDGMVPHVTWIVDTATPAIVKALQCIDVPCLSDNRRGVFIVELIGNGVRCAVLSLYVLPTGNCRCCS